MTGLKIPGWFIYELGHCVGRTVYKDRTMVWILILSQDMTNF